MLAGATFYLEMRCLLMVAIGGRGGRGVLSCTVFCCAVELSFVLFTAFLFCAIVWYCAVSAEMYAAFAAIIS